MKRCKFCGSPIRERNGDWVSDNSLEEAVAGGNPRCIESKRISKRHAISNRVGPWKEDYEMPQGEDRCPARYGGAQCMLWRSQPHGLHWAADGNFEWRDGEKNAH